MTPKICFLTKSVMVSYCDFKAPLSLSIPMFVKLYSIHHICIYVYSNCGLVVKMLALKAGDPGSIPRGGKF